MVNNVTKVVSNNFGQIWKMLLYKVVIGIFCGGLFLLILPLVRPVITEIQKTDFLSSLVALGSQILSGGYFLQGFTEGYLEPLNESMVTVGEILASNAVRMAFAYAIAALILLVFRFLFKFTDYAVSYAVNENMSSNAKLGFASTVTKTLKPAFRFWLAHLLVTLPYDAVMFGVIFTMIYYLLPVFGVLTIFFAVLLLAALLSLRMVLFSLWMPESINNGGNEFAALKKSMSISFKNFWRHLGNFLILVFIIIALSLFLIIYTFGSGFIILLPLVGLFIITYSFVLYYTETRRSYYINYDTIINPPADLNVEAQNYTIPEEEVQARMAELKKEREEMEGESKR